MNHKRSRKLLKRFTRQEENHFEKRMKYKTRSRDLIKSLSSIKTSMITNSSSKHLPASYKDALKIYAKEKKSRIFGSSSSFYKGIKFNKNKRCSSSKKKQLRNIVSFNEMNLFRDSSSTIIDFRKSRRDNISESRLKKLECVFPI